MKQTPKLLIAAFIALAVPLMFTGIAGAVGTTAFVNSDGMVLNEWGQWVVEDPGYCINPANPAGAGQNFASRALCQAATNSADQTTCQTSFCTDGLPAANAAECNARGYAYGTIGTWNATEGVCYNRATSKKFYGNTGECTNPAYTNSVDCLAADANWTAKSNREGCLHCHGDWYGTRPLPKGQDAYALTGHKNASRKLTVNPSGEPYNYVPLGGPYWVAGEEGALPYSNVDWETGLTGTSPMTYMIRGWFWDLKRAQIMRVDKDPNTVNATAETNWNVYGCARCHTSGYDHPNALEPVGHKTDTTMKVMQFGIQCATCHTDGYTQNHRSTTPRNELSTSVCYECHQYQKNADQFEVKVTPSSFAMNGTRHVDPVAHFLNSPHGRFSGTTAADITNSAMYDSAFRTLTYCSDPQYNTIQTCTNASATWNTSKPVNSTTLANNAGCTGCHDPHAGAVDPLELDMTSSFTQMKAMCANCHSGQAASINHPSGQKTPMDKLVPGNNVAKATQFACVTCHMGQNTAHVFRINPAADYSTGNATGYGTKYDDDGYMAVASDVNIACGQCHGGNGDPKPGIIKFSRAQLSAFAENMHNTIPRTASFTWALGAGSNQVDFDASASVCASTPCSYDWNFGDGTTGTGVTTSRTYAAAGKYLVLVKVTDNTGAQTMSPIRQISVVSQNTAPTAIKAAPVVSGMSVQITDQSTDNEDAQSALAVTVLCGNSTVATGAGGTTLTCNYTTAGSYTIRHSVKDTGGLGNSSANVTVSVGGSASRQTVSGTLTKQDGSPVSGGTLYLQVGTQAKYVAVSQATTGNFTFTNVLPGTYTIRVIKGGLTFTNPAESDPASIVVSDTPVTGVVVKSIQ
jgi:predicted CXXCH cytochrome family protein